MESDRIKHAREHEGSFSVGLEERPRHPEATGRYVVSMPDQIMTNAHDDNLKANNDNEWTPLAPKNQHE
jgi:hypothetical protein